MKSIIDSIQLRVSTLLERVGGFDQVSDCFISITEQNTNVWLTD